MSLNTFRFITYIFIINENLNLFKFISLYFIKIHFTLIYKNLFYMFI